MNPAQRFRPSPLRYGNRQNRKIFFSLIEKNFGGARLKKCGENFLFCLPYPQIGGTFWTKSELTLKKIRNRRRNASRAFYLAPYGTRTTLPPRLGRAPSSRARKTKNFLTFQKNGGGCRGEPQKIERKFYGFAFAASLLQKRLVNKNNITCSISSAFFSVACGDPRRYARGNRPSARSRETPRNPCQKKLTTTITLMVYLLRN